MVDWKRTFVETGFAVIDTIRADRWLARATRGSGIILTFHHVRPWRDRHFAPNRFLEVTPEFLDLVIVSLGEAGFEVVSLDQVSARLGAERLEKPFAAITFDDGYRDNLHYAWPILKRRGVPWTLFVVTDFIDRRGRLWWLELEEAIARLESIEVVIDGTKRTFDTRSIDEKNLAYAVLCRQLCAGPQQQLRDVTCRLAMEAGLDGYGLVDEACASWDEIATLAQDPDVTIGSHTRRHPILRRHDASFVAEELVESKSIIEHRLGRQVRHLAYPHGDRSSVGSREFAMAGEAGYVTAVTTRPGHLWPRHATRLTALPRVSMNGNFQSHAAVRALLSGVPFAGWTTFLN